MVLPKIQQTNAYLDQIRQNLTIVRSYDYYFGKMKSPLSPKLGEPNDNVLVNLARTISDTSTAYLFGEDVKIQVEDGTQAKQDFLDLFWKYNQKQVLLQKAAINGSISGHAFIRIIPETPFPRLIVLDSASVTVDTDPNDCSQVWCYTITPEGADNDDDDNKVNRTLIQTPSGQAGYDTGLPNDRWEITDQEYQSGAWVTVRSQTWPFSFPPIADCQNKPLPSSYWGSPDLTGDVLHIIDVINRVASHMNKTLRYYAHPLVYSTGMGSRQLSRAIDEIVHLPSTEAKLQTLEMQGDLGSSLAFLDRLLQYLSMITRIPATSLGVPDQLGQISGVALKIRYAPLVQLTESKRLLYGAMIECLNSWVLEMAGFGAGTETNLIWFPIIPSDDLQEAQVFQVIENLGIISHRTMAEKFDLDYDSELAEMAAEQALQEQLGLKKPAPLVVDNNTENIDNSENNADEVGNDVGNS